MRRMLLTVSLATVGLLAVFSVMICDGPVVDPFALEIAQLERVRDHAEPGTATYFKTEAKMARIERHRTGAPGFEAPE